MNTIRRRNRRGSTAMEFALVIIAAVPMLFGLVALGITLGRGVQAIQVSRDVGHMYGLGVDFSQSGAQSIVAKLAKDFSLNPTTGNAVLIFSKVQRISQSNCNAAPVPCNNLNQPVFTHRLVIGNSSLRASQFGTPPSSYIDPDGDIQADKYLQYSTLIASNFDSVLNLVAGEYTTMVEGFFKQPDLNFLSPGFAQTNRGTYVRVLF